MVAAGGLTGGQYPPDVQKQNVGVLVRDDIDHERFGGHTGVGFSKDLSRSGMTEDTPVPQKVIPFDGHAAGEDDSEVLHQISHI